jgi:hypothetical protein
MDLRLPKIGHGHGSKWSPLWSRYVSDADLLASVATLCDGFGASKNA